MRHSPTPLLRRLLCAGLALLGAPLVHATSYYLSSSTGSDSNAGTSSAAPWATIGKVNAVNLAAGDRIYLKGGDQFLDAGLVFLAADAGTAANPIVVDNYGTGRATLVPPTGQHGINIYNTGGVTVRNLDLTGPGLALSDANPKAGVSLWCDLSGGVRKSGLRFENLYITQFYNGVAIGANHSSFSGFQDVVVTGCTVRACVSDGITTYGYYPGTSTKQSHKNLQILNTTVSECYGDPTITASNSGSGIVMAGTLGGLIDNCVAHDNGGGSNDSSGGGPVGIWCWGCDSVVIQHCLVYNQKTTTGVVDGGGFDIDGGATNCTVQYCYSYNNEGPGYEVIEFAGAPTLSNATIRYNLSWKDGRRAQPSLSVWNGNTSASTLSNAKFYNNIVVSEGTANPAVGLVYATGGFTAKFYNNILIATGGSKLVDVGSSTGNYVFKGNLYHATSGSTPQWTWGATTYTTLAAWRAASGTPEVHSGTAVGLYADPLLTAALTGYAATAVTELATMTAFIPTATSPAINAGQNLTTSGFGSIAVGSVDFKGAAIPVGAYDIGAYEKQ